METILICASVRRGPACYTGYKLLADLRFTDPHMCSHFSKQRVWAGNWTLPTYYVHCAFLAQYFLSHFTSPMTQAAIIALLAYDTSVCRCVTFPTLHTYILCSMHIQTQQSVKRLHGWPRPEHSAHTHHAMKQFWKNSTERAAA